MPVTSANTAGAAIDSSVSRAAKVAITPTAIIAT